MGTITGVKTALETKLVSQTSIAAILTNPLRRDEAIPAGATRAAVLAMAAPISGNVNELFTGAQYLITVAHYLSDPADEGAYLDGDALTDQAALMLPSFYRTLSDVNEVEEIELDPPDRPDDGNVIEYTIGVTLSIS